MVLTASLAVALFGGRDYRNPNGGAQTRVEGDAAVTTHETPPVFGDDLTARYDLPVRNWWNEPIHIRKVIPSCSCSKAELAARDLPAGGETTLHVEVNFPPNGGVRDISIQLEAETGQRLAHRFKAVGYPYAQLDDEQGVVSFGDVLPGQKVAVAKTLFLHAPKRRGGLPEVVSVRGPPYLTAWVDPPATIEELPDGHGFRGVATFHVALNPRLEAGAGFADLAVEYRAQGVAGRQQFGVKWNVKELIVFDPPRLFLSVGSNQLGPRHHDVWILSRDERPFRVTSVKSSVPWVREPAATSETALAHVLAFEIHSEQAADKAFTEIEVGTDHPSVPTIRLPVSLLRKAGSVN